VFCPGSVWMDFITKLHAVSAFSWLRSSSDYRMHAMDCESQIGNMLRVVLSTTDYVTTWWGRMCALSSRQIIPVHGKQEPLAKVTLKYVAYNNVLLCSLCWELLLLHSFLIFSCSSTYNCVIWCFSDRASYYKLVLITNLMYKSFIL
jgi:hypothetical protein